MSKSSSSPLGDAPPPGQLVVVRRTYRSSIETVFGAWTNPASLEKWFGPPGFSAKILVHDFREGGSWRFLMTGGSGEAFHHFGTFIEILPPRKLIFTWASEEQVEGWRDEHGNPTRVTVDFQTSSTGASAGTTVTITHHDLVSDRARTALDGGWSGGLTCLMEFLGEQENG